MCGCVCDETRGGARRPSVNDHTSRNSPRPLSYTMIPASSGTAPPRCLLALLLLLLLVHPSSTQPATLVFDDCYTGDASRKMSVDTVYSQIIDDQTLNITVLGDTAEAIINSNTSLGMFTRRFPRVSLKHPTISRYALHGYHDTHNQYLQ